MTNEHEILFLADGTVLFQVCPQVYSLRHGESGAFSRFFLADAFFLLRKILTSHLPYLKPVPDKEVNEWIPT